MSWFAVLAGCAIESADSPHFVVIVPGDRVALQDTPELALAALSPNPGQIALLWDTSTYERPSRWSADASIPINHLIAARPPDQVLTRDGQGRVIHFSEDWIRNWVRPGPLVIDPTVRDLSDGTDPGVDPAPAP